MAADRPSPFKRLTHVAVVSLVLACADAEETTLDGSGTAGLIAYLEARTTEELSSILTRAETVLQRQEHYASHHPIALILHGDETAAFLKDNYSTHRELVDLAARLDAFNVIDVQVCETWMRENGVSRKQLPPFVTTVPFGPAAEQELIQRGFDHF